MKKFEDYDKLKESFVIFVCEKDYYGLGYPIYEFRNYCETNKSLEFGDETRKLVLNASGDLSMVSAKLATFLAYVKDGTVLDVLAERLQRRVDAIKQSEKARREYMMWELKLRDEYNAGVIDGQEKGEASVIQIYKLYKQDMTIAEIADSIHADADKVTHILGEFNLL